MINEISSTPPQHVVTFAAIERVLAPVGAKVFWYSRELSKDVAGVQKSLQRAAWVDRVGYVTSTAIYVPDVGGFAYPEFVAVIDAESFCAACECKLVDDDFIHMQHKDRVNCKKCYKSKQDATTKKKKAEKELGKYRSRYGRHGKFGWVLPD